MADSKEASGTVRLRLALLHRVYPLFELRPCTSDLTCGVLIRLRWTDESGTTFQLRALPEEVRGDRVLFRVSDGAGGGGSGGIALAARIFSKCEGELVLHDLQIAAESEEA
jgi:hypothetical protein